VESSQLHYTYQDAREQGCRLGRLLQDKTQVPTYPNLNFSKGTGSYYLDKIIEEQKKDEGRKKRFEAIKSEQKTKQQKINHLKAITKVSTASLAANNHYTLDENVLDWVLQKEPDLTELDQT
jgi:hypothetical protein